MIPLIVSPSWLRICPASIEPSWESQTQLCDLEQFAYMMFSLSFLSVNWLTIMPTLHDHSEELKYACFANCKVLYRRHPSVVDTAHKTHCVLPTLFFSIALTPSHNALGA